MTLRCPVWATKYIATEFTKKEGWRRGRFGVYENWESTCRWRIRVGERHVSGNVKEPQNRKWLMEEMVIGVWEWIMDVFPSMRLNALEQEGWLRTEEDLSLKVTWVWVCMCVTFICMLRNMITCRFHCNSIRNEQTNKNPSKTLLWDGLAPKPLTQGNGRIV